MKLFAQFVALIVVLVLSGCSGVRTLLPEGHYMLADITLAEAREVMDAEVNRLVAFVDPEIRAEDYQGPISPRSAMWCDPRESGPVDESYGVKLPGGATLEVHQTADLDPLVGEIAEAYQGKPGWEVEQTLDFNGRPQVKLFSPDGFRYYLNYFPPGGSTEVWEISIWSFSPCMPVADDYSPHKEY